MRRTSVQKYCADPEAIAAMKRDGMGWGHDVECGCFNAPAKPRGNILKHRFIALMKGA